MPVIAYLFRCFLLPALFVTAWDIAVFTKDEINFFNNQSSIGSVGGRLKEMVAGAYDPLGGLLYVSDANQKNFSIFRINLSRPYEDPMAVLFQSVVSKSAAFIPDLAFDPVTSTLFWTTGNDKSIMKLALSEPEKMNLPSSGEVVHQFKSEKPYGLALDSCSRTMYWTNVNHPNVSIEMSKIDGSDRKVIVNTQLYQPYGIIVDQNWKKIFWCDSNEQGAAFKIERSNLDGSDRQIVIQGLDQNPFGISIAQNRIYWTNELQKTLMSLPKHTVGGAEGKIIKQFDKGVHGLVSGALHVGVDVNECTALAVFLPKIQKNYLAETNIFKSGSTESGTTEVAPPKKLCLNNGVLENGICKCDKYFKGQNCEIPICTNYCVCGWCEVDAAGPICRCKKGWTGVRCEIERCRGMCLNNGKCSINVRNETVCECIDGYQGRRCEIASSLLTELCKPYCLFKEQIAKPHYLNSNSEHDPKNSIIMAETCRCSEILSTVTDRPDSQPLVKEFGTRVNVAVISILAILCVVLGLMVLFLTVKVFALKKRPRIRKRIVVNKPLAPFACRPQSPREQCEITIENCCNMNICETPCFEPEFKPSKATFSRTKSEDKRILINSMHSNSSQDDENY